MRGGAIWCTGVGNSAVAARIGEEWQVWKEDVTNGSWVIRSSGGREMAAGADAYIRHSEAFVVAVN